MSKDQALLYTDEVLVTHVDANGGRLQESVPVDTLRSILNTPPFGPNEVKVDTIIDFTGNATKYLNVLTIPAGALITYVAAYIVQTVVGGSTTVKLGLGANGGTTNSWGVLATLTAGTAIQSCFSTVVAAQTSLDVNGVVTAGTSLGDTNVTAGMVHVVVIYKTPTALTA